MNVAIPVWEGRVSPVFDTASRLLVFEVEDRLERARFETRLQPDQDLARRCQFMRDMEIDTLICGAVSGYFHRMLKASGIRVIPWISGSLEEVLEAYLAGDLFQARFLMPGCARKKRRKGKGRGMGNGNGKPAG
ncbi:MAG: hypothetical protein DRH56_02425 [Deltaproteobacteria bacterium]|nr:MAG: hypothetical protein DRH56_02425 [Deltaproteobacteria bacterium]